LRQRIAILSRLQPFNPAETNSYINHRLSIAGHKGHSLFTAEARALIAHHSQGVPRNINNLCFNALSLGCSLKRKTIDASILHEVVADFNVCAIASEQQGTHLDKIPVSLKVPLSGFQPIQKRGGGRVAFLAAALCFFFVLVGLWWLSRPTAIEGNANTANPVSISPLVMESSHKNEPEVSSNIRTEQPLTVVVEPHDTLSLICFRYLGKFDQETVKAVFELNPKLMDPPNVVRSGDTIRLPGQFGPLKGESLIYGPGNKVTEGN